MHDHSGRSSQAFVALLREAGIASSMLGSGVTLLGKASARHHGIYNEAFFDLSIGLERLAKLIIVVEHAVSHNGEFLDNNILKKRYGHKIGALLECTQRLAAKYLQGQKYGVLPNTDIHNAMVEVLSDFAHKTRYYNLNLLTDSGNGSSVDPIAAWYWRVGQPIMARHYSKRQRTQDSQFAASLEEAIGSVMLVHHTREDGELIGSVQDASLTQAQTKIVSKYSRFYALQIIRHLAYLLWEVESEAQQRGLADIPYLHEFFGIFMNEDSYFRRRKTWLPYGR